MYRFRIGGLLAVLVLSILLAGPQPGYAQDGESDPLPHPAHRHTLEDQTFHAWDRKDVSPGALPAPETLNLKAPSGVNGGANISRVYALNFDPIYQNGQPLSAYANWNNPDSMVDLTMASINSSAKAQYFLKVGQTVTVRDYPLRNDGNRLNNTAYQPCLQAFVTQNYPALPAYCKADADDPVYAFSLARNLRQNYDGTGSACDAIRAGRADEIWVWAMPGANAWEWYVDAPDVICPGVKRQFGVIVFNYERGLAQALESFGHRVEWTLMNWTEYSVPTGVPTDFNRFTGNIMGKYSSVPYTPCPAAPDADQPEVDANNTGAGNAHFTPNAYCHYQYNRDKLVWSTAEDWKNNYPALTGQKDLINRATWSCPNGGDCEAGFLIWWLDHFPSRNSYGAFRNWWTYMFFASGPCSSAVAPATCAIDTRAVYASPFASDGGQIEFITAYGKYWKYGHTVDNKQLLGHGDLTDVARFTQAGGPCAGRTAGTCRFDTRAVYASPIAGDGGQVEFITAYGKYWKYAHTSSSTALLASGDLTSDARYTQPGGPCAGKPAGTCRFDTRSVYTSPYASDGGQVEFITVDGKYWKYAYTAANTALIGSNDLTAIARFTQAGGPCAGKPAGACRLESHAVYPSPYASDGGPIEFVTTSGNFWKYQSNTGHQLLYTNTLDWRFK